MRVPHVKCAHALAELLKVLDVRAARASACRDLLRDLLERRRSEKVGVLGRRNVHERASQLSVLAVDVDDAAVVASLLALVKLRQRPFDVLVRHFVHAAPHLSVGLEKRVLVAEARHVVCADECHDAAKGVGCAAVVR